MKKIKILTILILTIFFGAGYFYIVGRSENERPIIESGENDVSQTPIEAVPQDLNNEVRVIKIGAERFKFSQEIINIKKGERVKIIVEDKDINHGIMIPDLVFPPTQKSFTEITLQVEKEGEYKFYCSNEMCGRGHGEMVGKIIVV